MAGAACKWVMNNGTRALSEGMEKALTNPLVRGPMIAVEDADSLLDRLVRIDLAAVDGSDLGGDSMLHVLAELVKAGVVTDEVWRLYAKPADS